MSRVCDICGKGRQLGYSVSHAHNKTRKQWIPNLQKVKAIKDGRTMRIRVCTECIKSGQVQKA